MTNQIFDRLDRVEELLLSTARYAETANRGLERLETVQQRSQLQIDQLTLKIDQLAEAQKRTEQRLESFIYESQRLMTGHAERISQLEGISGRLEGILSYLVRKEGPGE